MRSVPMHRISNARQIEEDERELERVPAAVLRLLERRQRLRPTTTAVLRPQRVRTLQRHRPVREAERIARLLTLPEKADALGDPAACVLRPLDQLTPSL